MPGAPTTYNKERADKIIQALRNGAPRRAAAGAAGVVERTLRSWMHRHADFADQVELAEMFAVRAHLANIHRAAANGNWTASAWFLERRYPEEFGRVDRVEVYRVGQQARIVAEELQAEGIDVTPEQLVAERENLVRALPMPGKKKLARS